MLNDNSFNDLITNNHLYKNLGEKFDIPQSLYNKTIGQVCVELNLNRDLIQTLLKSYDDNFDFPLDELSKFSICEILNYLKLTHRFYLYKKLPEIEQTILQLHNNYSETHQFLILMCHHFVVFKNKLIEHIKFEETVLFPYVQKLIELSETNSMVEIKNVLSSFSVKKFNEVHSDIEIDLQQVRLDILTSSKKFNNPLPFRVFLCQIEYFEIDLCKHAMIEDDVLMKKIELLENNLKQLIKHQ